MSRGKNLGSSQTWSFAIFYVETLFCARLRTFADLRLRSFADLRLRSFALVCVFLHPTAFRTTASGTAENRLLTVSRQFLTRNYPRLSRPLKRPPKLSLAPKSGLECISQNNPRGEGTCETSKRQKLCLAAIFSKKI